MDKLGQIVGKRLYQHKLGDSAKASLVLRTANLFLKERLDCDETEMQALRLKEGTLTIGSCSSVWSQELRGHQEDLMAEIKKEYGEKAVSKILIKGLTSH